MNAKLQPAPEPQAVSRADFDDLLVPVYAPSQVVPRRARGLWLQDQQGVEYLDLTSGIGVTSLGHAHPAVVQALQAQAEQLWHVGNGYTNEPVLRLASLLTGATFADRAFFCNSGAEANEAALKLARRHAALKHGDAKRRIVACQQSFHGRTLFTVTAGGQPKYTEGFEPLPPGIGHVPFNDIAAAEQAMGDDVCAVIVEPVQGEGGVLPASHEYLQALRRLCDRHDALLIFDEVQCGLGRTGSLYAYMHYGVEPDILTTAKALGNGYPIGAMLTRHDLATSLSVGTHGTTYGGNPLACAVAAAVVQIIQAPAFLTRVGQAAERLHAGLQQLLGDFPGLFTQVRGRGMMIGLVLDAAQQGRAKEFTRAAEQERLMLLIAGPNVVRLLPPLVISDAEIDEALLRLRATARRFLAPQS
ncbi:acetylornithine/succinyldiaminopimelate transaminase [Eleftheria terrae]|uniref:acetylornithine/succinyldiaminopimelate transaminase n=1 Tax=Eleftheria terrae TaxID=1597781 RepID=UPI00263BA2F7|nr:acetylornithine/succinyldiaminopimelate transaminase [Eleftheria terrae]WKB53425.1 acetylornithine/succinyldiaminopimelate transaminase [Eleftheria terrae]